MTRKSLRARFTRSRPDHDGRRHCTVTRPERVRGAAVRRRLLHRKLLPVAHRTGQGVQRQCERLRAHVFRHGLSQDPDKGQVARYEVRPGDVPLFGGGERSEVQGGTVSGGIEGQTRWYRFSTRFDPSYPANHADLGWAVTNQWHAYAGGSPPVSWTTSMKNGYWSLTIEKQSAPDEYLGQLSIFDTPLDVGQWHDVMMAIHWSSSDDQRGWVRLWLQRDSSKLLPMATIRILVRTLIPGTTGGVLEGRRVPGAHVFHRYRLPHRFSRRR